MKAQDEIQSNWKNAVANHPYPEQFLPGLDTPIFHGVPRSYLIASTPRCGSHFLGHALLETGHFGVPLEYLNGNNIRYWHKRFKTGTITDLLRKLSQHRTSPSGWFAVKAHWPNFAPYRLDNSLTPIGGISRIIFLYRRDLLGQSISFLRALQTKQWIATSPKRGDETYSYHKIVRCGKKLRMQNKNWASYLSKTAEIPSMTMVYEDMLLDKERHLRSISKFLDPSFSYVSKMPERITKQTDTLSRDWREKFLNDLQDEDSWIVEPQYWP